MCYIQVFSISYNNGISLLMLFDVGVFFLRRNHLCWNRRIDFYKSVKQYSLDSVIMIFT